MSESPFFNAHHSPIGAFASFTLGSRGACGGLGLELAGPANEGVYIGVEERERPGHFRALPFFQIAEKQASDEKDYDVEGLGEFQREPAVGVYADHEITRLLGAAVDTWMADDLTFRLVSPVQAVPDPSTSTGDGLKRALTPAIIAELTVDNRRGITPRKAFFGYAGSDPASKMRVWREQGVLGVGQGTSTAIATADLDVYAGIAWQPEAILNYEHAENLPFMLGSIGVLVGMVQAGEVRTFRFAVCFFREGTATTGIRTRYLYRRWFDQIEEVAGYALEESDRTVREGIAFDRRLSSELSRPRALMAAQAIRSYFGCTQCLEREDGAPLWIVHEGEYRMMNTFDLIVDQAFFELALNPWTVRNELDLYAERYAYQDEVCFPRDTTRHPGGIAFTHDVGVANAFSAPGHSGYEQAGLRGCFSFMSCEELLNWALTASLYISHTGDYAWAENHATTFRAIIRSLMQRDHPDPKLRNGVMGLDSSRCAGGKEITTYDSLDASLGQARNNVYLAVKTWAAYVLLEPMLRRLGEEDLALAAADQAARCASTLVSSVESDGSLPAVLDENVPARIIPAIEALVYPLMAGKREVLEPDGPFGDLRRALERHFDQVLRTNLCRFADGGWRLSSTSRNSWMSKIFLCQFVAERIFGRPPDDLADAAHLAWLMRPENAYYAFCDQMLEGEAVGSRYYPRGVTSMLWLTPDAGAPLAGLGDKLRGRIETANPEPRVS
ncbi:MAG TPA: glycoside hydrolase family 52 protein [Fimbriimonadaceae bacterium]|nr:glycoside hydrolase family 52 protein [Fimbriimonadaceae bacterium]